MVSFRILQVLVLSFHGRFSARILQVHYENKRIVVRPSRLLNMYTTSPSADVRLAIRWLLCKPVGDTRRSAPPPPDKYNETGPAEVWTEQEESPEQVLPMRPITVA